MRRQFRRGAAAQRRLEQRLEEAAERDVLVAVAADHELLGGGVDGAVRIEAGGEDSEVDVAHEAAEHDEAVGGFDVSPDLVAAHRAFVDAQVERVALGDDALAQERRGDGDARLRGQLQQRGLESEAVDFGVGEDHGALRGVDHPDGLGDALRERVRVGHLLERRQAPAVRARDVDAVARELDEARPLVALDGVQDAVNLLVRRRRVLERGDGDGDVAEDFALGGEVADAVMEQRVARAFGHAGRAGDDEDGRFFRPRAGDGVGEAEPADAVSHARHAEPAQPRVGVGREPRAVLARHADELDGAFFHERVELKDVVARHPEHVPRAPAVTFLNQVLPDRDRLAHPALLTVILVAPLTTLFYGAMGARARRRRFGDWETGRFGKLAVRRILERRIKTSYQHPDKKTSPC